MIVGMTVLASCRKYTINRIEESVTDGQWKVALFEDDGRDGTEGFSEYVFDFNDDGTVVATIHSLNVIVHGIWSAEKADNCVDFKLYMEDPITELNRDWSVKDRKKSEIELIADDGDKLTLRKI